MIGQVEVEDIQTNCIHSSIARNMVRVLLDVGLGRLLDSNAFDNSVQICYGDLVACYKSVETNDIQTGINFATEIC